MRKILLLIIIVLAIQDCFAQTCKIKINYDNNGSRIQRRLDCSGMRPGAPDANDETGNRGDVAVNTELWNAVYTVYPNPAETKVTVQLDAASLKMDCSILLVDLAGRVMFTKTGIAQSQTVIDLKAYADGPYFIIIKRGEKSNTVKIVKQTGSSY